MWSIIKNARHIGTVYRIVKMVLAEMEEADKVIAARYSEAWWAEFRKRTEICILKLYLHADRGLLKMFQTDNMILKGLLIWMKSDHLYAIERARTTEEREQAIQALLDKNAVGSLAKLTKQYPCH